MEIVAVSEELIRLTPELAEQLDRRHRVPDLILEAKRCNRQPFPNWM